MRTIPSAVAAFFLLASVPGLARDAAAQGQPMGQGSQQGPQVSEDEVKSLKAMIAFVRSHAAMAGATSACDAGRAEILRTCTGLAVRNWAQSSGQAPFSDPGAAARIASSVWEDAFGNARETQLSMTPPMTCQQVIESAGHAPVLSICRPQGQGGGPPGRGQGPAQRGQ